MDEDKIPFTYAKVPVFPYKFVLKYYDQETRWKMVAISNWCKENFGLFTINSTWRFKTGEYEGRFEFKREKDALLFKLRWM